MDRSDKIEDDVDVFRGPFEGRRAVVVEFIGPESAPPVVLGCAGRSDDIRTEVFRDLEGPVTDPPPAA
ncbi:hypothetical protein [Kineosporia sp. NBRC 101731]|uniref:hypothetical protein n=1 Tax=Kineosporia sp. NBRC 101731 TaxID=3032199 RepID=UPI0024A5FA53|nr:hypothetical protein [Kineosporia sp. NBRC 101731]GLY32572.1 hypothetical protein Kisp02_59370 [Kineosporia sp. NBRC 101731]